MCRDKDLNLKGQRDLAIWERNMLVLFLAKVLNLDKKNNGCGYYIDKKTDSTVISLCDGQVTFKVPNDFDLGTLPKIINNHDGHTNRKMWQNIRKFCNSK